MVFVYVRTFSGPNQYRASGVKGVDIMIPRYRSYCHSLKDKCGRFSEENIKRQTASSSDLWEQLSCIVFTLISGLGKRLVC